MATKVLVIEDDKDIASLLCLHLKDLNFECDRAADGTIGYEKALSSKYNLVVLDLMLPGMDGLEICQKLRAEKIQTPILMLTSKSDELDKVLGLEIGADDYLTKPFSVREFLARVKAIVRRSRVEQQHYDGKQKLLDFDQLRIDLEKRKVSFKGKTVELTAKEFDLLVLFASHPGRVYNRQQLLDLVWGYQFDGYDHTVNSHINRLRAKIEDDPSNPEYIQTVWGVGYKFADREE